MFPTNLMKKTHESLARSAKRSQETWSKGPMSGLAQLLSRLPGLNVRHVEHGAWSAATGLTIPRILVAIENPHIAALIGRSIQRSGSRAITRLDWIIRHFSDNEHPWISCIKGFDYTGTDDWNSDLWWIHPLDEPADDAGQRKWLEDAYSDYETGEVLGVYIRIMLESELARRAQDDT